MSFGYSRFLDLHIYNYPPNVEQPTYCLTTTLAYKINSTFAYTPKFSNIHKGYKTAIVPISLYRAHSRCTDSADVNHHISFMKNIVQARNQDPTSVHQKYEAFFKKRRSGHQSMRTFTKVKTTPILYDSVSGQHRIVRRLVKSSFGSSLNVVYKSRSKVPSLLCPKRKNIKRLSRMLLQS